MAPSTSGKNSRPTCTAKNEPPASSATPTSTSAGGRKTQKNTTAEAIKIPSKRGRKAVTAIAGTMAASSATNISAEELSVSNSISAHLAVANKAQKEAADLGAVILFI